MPVHVALLRAVNVGGTGSLPMADLKAICEGLGFCRRQDLHSERKRAVPLRSAGGGSSRDAGQRPSGKARQGAGRDDQDRRAIAGDRRSGPFPNARPNLLLVVFLREPAPADALDKLVAPDGEEAQVAGAEIYIHFPNGSGRSKFKLPAAKPAPRATSIRCASSPPWRLRWKADAPQGPIPDGKPLHLLLELLTPPAGTAAGRRTEARATAAAGFRAASAPSTG